MSLFVDTSFLVALLDGDDGRAGRAAELWRGASAAGTPVLTTDYVVLESCAVLQRRLGLEAVRRLTRDTLAPVVIEWVTRVWGVWGGGVGCVELRWWGGVWLRLRRLWGGGGGLGGGGWCES